MARRSRKSAASNQAAAAPITVAQGGTWAPLSDQSLGKIQQTAFTILTDIGVSEAPDTLCDIIIDAGGRCENDRLFYPRDLLEAVVQEGPKQVLLAGQNALHDLKLGGSASYTGTGGAAPTVLDDETKTFANVSHDFGDVVMAPGTQRSAFALQGVVGVQCFTTHVISTRGALLHQ